MRTIIAGSRTITDYALVERAMEAARDQGIVPTAIISGGAKGVDTLGQRWAKEHGLPCERFLAEWTRLGKAAGIIRNVRMAYEADALVAVWDGNSAGTRHMIAVAMKERLPIHVKTVAYVPSPPQDGWPPKVGL